MSSHELSQHTLVLRGWGEDEQRKASVHVADRMPDLPRKLRALPDPEGRLLVLRTPIPLAFEGTGPLLAHPLLVYAELLSSNDDRAHEAAREVRHRFLEAAT